MSLKNYSREEKAKMSMIELANLFLSDKNKAFNFKELFDKIAELKEFNEAQKETYIAQFYTDLNIDGRFLTTGSNTWGLKRWYPVEQIEEEVKAAPKKKKAKKKKTVKKKEPEVEEVESDAPDNDIEELTGDFSKLDGEDDVDEEDESLDIYDEDLDVEDDDLDDDELDEDDEDDEEEEEEVKRKKA